MIKILIETHTDDKYMCYQTKPKVFSLFSRCANNFTLNEKQNLVIRNIKHSR